MSDTCYISFEIGGPIRRDVLGELAEALAESGLRTEELLRGREAAIVAILDAAQLDETLKLENHFSRTGEPGGDLAKKCEQMGVDYNLWSGPLEGNPASYVAFRGNLKSKKGQALPSRLVCLGCPDDGDLGLPYTEVFEAIGTPDNPKVDLKKVEALRREYWFPTLTPVVMVDP